MSTHQIIGLVLLVVGAILLYFGYQSSQGLEDQVYETFTGRFTDSTLWLLISGAVAAVAGIGLLLRKG